MLKKIGDYLEIHDFTVETARDTSESGLDKAVIRGFLHITTPVKVLYMASLELDNVEMHESFRLHIDPEDAKCALPEVFVVNPIRSDDENIGKYTLTLKIYAAGGVVHEFASHFRF